MRPAEDRHDHHDDPEDHEYHLELNQMRLEVERKIAARPDISSEVNKARLPLNYLQARDALANCERIDECADWKNRAQAAASYWKQATDKSLYLMLVRIRLRAIRRCGELLLAIPSSEGGRPKLGEAPPLVSRAQAARDAGLSDDQRKQALRVARIRADDFEKAVESDNPPTLTVLTALGTPRTKNRIVAGFLMTDGGYPSEWQVACPTCAFEHSHIRYAGTLMGSDEGHVYPGTEVVGKAPDRRSAISIVFDGECGHAWEIRIQQRKGINLVEVYPLGERADVDR